MRGTIVNATAILIGSGIRLAAGSRLSGRLPRIITTGVGPSTLSIGVQMALKAQKVLVVIASVVIGGLAGEILDLEGGLERIGGRLLAVGSLLLDIKRLRVANPFPALVVVVALTTVRLSLGW